MTPRQPLSFPFGCRTLLLATGLLPYPVHAATRINTTVLVSVVVTTTCTVRTRPDPVTHNGDVAVQCPRGAQYILALQPGSLAALRPQDQAPVQTSDGVTATITY